MKIATSWHGVWNVLGYNPETKKYVIQQGRVKLASTMDELKKAGWNPRLVGGNNV